MFIFGEHVNLIWVTLCLFVVAITLIGGLVHSWQVFLPDTVVEAFHYGKTSRNVPSYNRLEISKAYFWHFYGYATLFTFVLWVFCLGVYFFEIPAPDFVVDALNFAATPNRREATTAEGAFLCITMLLAQVSRRCYEVLFVHAPSKAKMKLYHYIFGYVHYTCVALGYLSECPGMVPEVDVHRYMKGIRWLHVQFELRKVTVWQWSMVVLFVYASWKQRRHFNILAKIRNGVRESIPDAAAGVYAIPREEWFEYVSCPHFLAEILVYFSMAGVLGPNHQTGWIVFFWVLTNQLVLGLMTHSWYQDKFKTYPRERKAIIPFLL